MPEYLDDPSVLTKDKLKSELLAHNVELPSGNPPKDVFVQLYLKELTSQNVRHIPASLDGFSSDEDLPPPVVSSKSRSSGRKSTIRGEKVLLGELDVTVLDDQSLREELLSHGLDAGPIVASTRKLYEKKLQKLLDSDSTPSEVILPDTKVTSNGSTDPGLYSDQDDEVTEIEPEPLAVPEPVPVAERPLRSRGKGPLAAHTQSTQHTTFFTPTPVSPLQPLCFSSPYSLVFELKLSKCHFPTTNTKHSIIGGTLILVESRWNLDCGEPRDGEASFHPSTSRRFHVTLTCKTCLLVSVQTEKEFESGRCSSLGLNLQIKQGERAAFGFRPSCKQTGRPLQVLFTHLFCLYQSESSCLKVEKIAASEQTVGLEKDDVQKELPPSDLSSPTGITATCRRPIKGAAERPVKPSELWKGSPLFSPNPTKTTSDTENRLTNRLASVPRSTASSSSRPVFAAPLAAQTKAASRSPFPWTKLLVLALLAALFFFVYQTMEPNSINPFDVVGVGGPSDG
uniref:Thymopoietin a n=1 Tax=Tetraodon nigroviridis TaxID=99883 RepID=H3CP57_TETNG